MWYQQLFRYYRSISHICDTSNCSYTVLQAVCSTYVIPATVHILQAVYPTYVILYQQLFICVFQAVYPTYGIPATVHKCITGSISHICDTSNCSYITGSISHIFDTSNCSYIKGSISHICDTSNCSDITGAYPTYVIPATVHILYYRQCVPHMWYQQLFIYYRQCIPHM